LRHEGKIGAVRARSFAIPEINVAAIGECRAYVCDALAVFR
jgi:hypothetical protein